MNDVKGLLIQLLESEFGNKDAIVGTVVGAPVGNLITVKSLLGEGNHYNIRLQANPGNGILVIPKDGSYVIVGRLTGEGGYVAMYSDADSIKLLDGSYGGLIKIDELVGKLNALETWARNTQTWLDLHNHPANGAPPSTVPSPSGPADTVNGDIENEDITHGAP